MKKTRRTYRKKPFKTKVRGKRFTIMLIPDSSANSKIKSINIPYPVFGIILVPFICIIAIVIVYQLRLIDLRVHVDNNESRALDYSYQLSEAADEYSRLEETLAVTEGLLMQSEAEAEAVRSRLNNIDSTIAGLMEEVEEIDAHKQNILDVFRELQETQGLNIPYTFDESVLTESAEGAVGGVYTEGADTDRILADIDVFLKNNVHDYSELEVFAGQLSTYFRARPAGLPSPGGTLRDGYGIRISPVTGDTELHEGLDVAGEMGDEIHATADGVVTFAGWNSAGFGSLVTISHAYGYSTFYAHNSEIVVREGDEVTRGQLIAYMGDSGDATGVHCHYEIRRNGVLQNPLIYVR